VANVLSDPSTEAITSEVVLSAVREQGLEIDTENEAVMASLNESIRREQERYAESLRAEARNPVTDPNQFRAKPNLLKIAAFAVPVAVALL